MVGVLRCTTTHGPAFRTVTGTTWPSGRKTWVMPIFLPRIPGLIVLKKQGVRSQESEVRMLIGFLTSDCLLIAPNLFLISEHLTRQKSGATSIGILTSDFFPLTSFSLTSFQTP